MSDIPRGMSSLSEDQVGTQLTTLIGATYMRLVHARGPALYENDRFNASFIHTVCSVAFSLWADSIADEPEIQMRSFIATRNTAVRNMASIVHQRTGVPPAKTAKVIGGVFDQFLQGDFANPFQSSLQLHEGIEKGIVAFFSGDKQGGIEALLHTAMRGYELFKGHDEPDTPAGEYKIDDQAAAGIAYAVLLQGLPEIEKLGEDVAIKVIPQTAMNAVCVITAALYAKRTPADRDPDNYVYYAAAQIMLRLIHNLIREDATPELKMLQEHYNQSNPGEARVMVISLLANPGRLERVMEALDAVESRDDSFFPDIPLDLVEAVNEAAASYMADEQKARRVLQ